jgi:hypothetical protein
LIFTLLLGMNIAHARHSHKKQAPPQIELQDFGDRNNDTDLKNAFEEFIKTIPVAKFPIKIDRSKSLTGPNKYYWGSTEIGAGLLTGGRSTINRSKTIGRTLIDRSKFGQLLEQLDKDEWVSKIIIEHPGAKYTVDEFGLKHALYRGAMRVTKVAAVSAVL